MPVVLYHAIMILSLIISLYVVVVVIPKLNYLGARTLLIMTIAAIIWTSAFLCESYSTTLSRQLFFNNIGYIGSMTVPAIWFVFSLRYTGIKLDLWKHVLPLGIIPVTAIVLTWTNQWHHLMWYNEHLQQAGQFLITVKTYGPFFWVAMTFNYAMVVAGIVIMLRRLFVGTQLYTGQAVSLIVAVLLPVIWNVIYVFHLMPGLHKDLTPAMFTISGLAIAVGVLRFRLLTVMPFTRQYIINQLSDGILIFDSQDRLLDVNSVAAKILGTRRSIIGKSLEEISGCSPVLARLSSIESRAEIAVPLAGEARIFELNKTPLYDGRRKQVGILATLHDVTDQRRIQRQLIEQDRLASLGQLVSGVAHELNNPLTSVIGFSELILNNEIPENIRADLSIINAEAQRTADIVRGLLVFARKQPEDKQLVDICDPIKSVLKMRTHEQLVQNITVSTSYNPDLMVMGNQSQLTQVFFNVIVNAEHAMIESHHGGNLNVTTERVGNRVRVCISDDGPGIPTENLSQLFTPFFTTKEPGKGTGMGLSISQGIIAEHGGNMWVESEPGKGAAFFIDLPEYKNTSIAETPASI